MNVSVMLCMFFCVHSLFILCCCFFLFFSIYVCLSYSLALARSFSLCVFVFSLSFARIFSFFLSFFLDFFLSFFLCFSLIRSFSLLHSVSPYLSSLFLFLSLLSRARSLFLSCLCLLLFCARSLLLSFSHYLVFLCSLFSFVLSSTASLSLWLFTFCLICFLFVSSVFVSCSPYLSLSGVLFVLDIYFSLSLSLSLFISLIVSLFISLFEFYHILSY